MELVNSAGPFGRTWTKITCRFALSPDFSRSHSGEKEACATRCVTRTLFQAV